MCHLCPNDTNDFIICVQMTQMTSLFWPGEFHGLYSPWDHKELDMTNRPSLSLSLSISNLGLPWWLSSKESACNAGDPGWISGWGRFPREGMATHSSILPGEFHGQKSLGMLWGPHGLKELDMTE